VSRPTLRKASKRQPSARTRPGPKPKQVTRARASSAVAVKARAKPAKRSKPGGGQQPSKAPNGKALKAKAPKAAKANGLRSSASSSLPQLRLVKTAPNNMNSSSAKGSAKVASAKAKLAGGKAARLTPAAARPGNGGRANGAVSGDNLEGLSPPKRRSTRTKSVSSALPQPAPVDPHVVAYESEALSVLASESAADDPGKANAEIKRRLRDKKLGPYERSRIEVLRAFKTALADEIHRGSSSSYFTGSHGLYASPEDFDHARLARDFTERYPGISHEAVAAFIPIAVYCYYLR
jgi:hypothetical protein